MPKTTLYIENVTIDDIRDCEEYQCTKCKRKQKRNWW